MSPRRPIPPASIGFVLWLVLMWVALWGSLTIANVATGLAVAALVLVAVPRTAPRGDTPIIRPVAALSFSAWFLWKLVEANIRVSIEVMKPPSRSRIRTGIVAVPIPGATRAVATAVANVITLTPGTSTIEIDPRIPTLYVHALQVTTPEAVRADVWDIERRIVAAVGSAELRRIVAERGGAE